MWNPYTWVILKSIWSWWSSQSLGQMLTVWWLTSFNLAKVWSMLELLMWRSRSLWVILWFYYRCCSVLIYLWPLIVCNSSITWSSFAQCFMLHSWYIFVHICVIIWKAWNMFICIQRGFFDYSLALHNWRSSYTFISRLRWSILRITCFYLLLIWWCISTSVIVPSKMWFRLIIYRRVKFYRICMRFL